VRVRRPDQHADARPRRGREPAAAPPAARILALQRSAGNQAVARALKQHSQEAGANVHDYEPGPGTVQQLAVVVKAVTTASDLDEGDVTVALSQFDGDDAADLVYDSIKSLVEYLGGKYTGGTADTGGSDGKEEKKGSGGQQVGKLTFEGDTYHSWVKRAVINAMGEKWLSLLVYKDSDHTNFNFWFEKNGDIYADVNSDLNNKGVWTGYRWNGTTALQVEVVAKKGGAKQRKGNRDDDW
jgi:hypothetical protein